MIDLQKMFKGLKRGSIRVKLMSWFLLVSILPLVVVMIASLSFSDNSLRKGTRKQLMDNHHGIDIELQQQENQLMHAVNRNAELPVLVRAARLRDMEALKQVLSQILILSHYSLIGLYDEQGNSLLHLEKPEVRVKEAQSHSISFQNKTFSGKNFEWGSSAFAEDDFIFDVGGSQSESSESGDDFTFESKASDSEEEQTQELESGIKSVDIEKIPRDLLHKIIDQGIRLNQSIEPEAIRISVFKRIHFDGRPIGILHQAIELDKSFVNHVNEKTGLEVVLIGSNGNHIVSTRSELSELSLKEAFSNNLRMVHEVGDYMSVFLLFSHGDGKIKGGIGLLQSLERYREGKKEFSVFFVLLFIISTLVVVCVTFFVAQSLSRPIQKISGEVLRVAEREGDLTFRMPVRSKDEIGELAESFNVMIQSFRGLMVSIRDVGLRISSQSSEISEGVNDQAAGAAQQSATVAQVTTTVAEFSQTASNIADNAGDLALSAEETLQGMTEAKAKVDEVAQKVLALGEKSQEVGKITKLIDTLADRTNLLALNASIEAARAGEAGHGFAVVAGEVGKLADQSAQSTNDIHKLISEIQSEISATIIGVEEASARTDKGLEKVSQAVQVIKEISISTMQQKSGAEEVVEAFMKIDDVASTFAATTQQTAAIAVELRVLSIILKDAISGYQLEDKVSSEISDEAATADILF